MSLHIKIIFLYDDEMRKRFRYWQVTNSVLIIASYSLWGDQVMEILINQEGFLFRATYQNDANFVFAIPASLTVLGFNLASYILIDALSKGR